MPRTRQHLLAVSCAGLMLAMTACVPPPPPIVLRPPAAARAPAARMRDAARDRRCQPVPARPALSEAEKTRLFDEFDGWQGERRPAGAAADAPVPPPAPSAATGTSRAVPAACRTPRG